MLIRLTLLLVLTNSIEAQVPKSHEVLKTLGKRYFAKQKSKSDPDIIYVTDSAAFLALPAENVTKLKRETMQKVAYNVITASSNKHSAFRDSLLYLESLLVSDFKGIVCDQNPMTSYEFMKYMTHTGAQFIEKFYADRKVQNFTIKGDLEDRHLLWFEFNFSLYDRVGGGQEMTYSVIMESPLRNSYYLDTKAIWQIISIEVRGTCPNDAKYEGTRVDQEVSRNNETVMWFKGLFVPKFPDWYDSDPNNLPTKWLELLKAPNPTVTISLNVCHEKDSEATNYTIDQFISWYTRFGTMWAVSSDEDNFEHQLFDHLDDHISARVTMKLQMRTKKDAPVLDWQFKYSANHWHKEWIINKVEVLCNVKVEYKDESYLHVRDIIMERFVHNIEDVGRNNTPQWYSTIDFMRRFSKNGQVRLHWCDKHTVSNVSQLELFTYAKGQKYNTRFVKYWFDKPEVSLPAPDFDEIRFKTISEADTEKPEFQYEHEWVFQIRWHVMDQFYYIEKMTMGCGKEMKDGEFMAADHMVFNFGGKRRHRK